MNLEFLREKTSKLTASPGVYLMKDKSGKIIYVGKAKSLKNRVSSYFHGLERHAVKTVKLVERIHDFDFIVTPSELDALVLEASLIKLHQPKYNILLKDAKGFNYIKITRGGFPKLSYTRSDADKNADYIGPYANGFTIRQTVTEANRIFMLPSCGRKFPDEFGKGRPCLNYHIKRCIGVCLGGIGEDEYKKRFRSALDYIKGGSKESIRRLTAEMEEAAESLNFEKAARLRDSINQIVKTETAQKVQSSKTTDYDIIAFAQNVQLASVAVVKYRGGKIIDMENFYIGDEFDEQQMREEFLLEYYGDGGEIPREIYTDCELNDAELLESYLSGKAEHKIKLVVPKRGEGLTQLTLAKSNAAEYLSLKVGRTAKEINALEDLAKLLGLDKIPEYIECYDISNLGESARVGGMVVYRNGKPYKKGYRKFAIKESGGQDDYACMREVVRRRFTRLIGNKEYGGSDDGGDYFEVTPDLILLDGGTGHVHAVSGVLEELGVGIPLFGLVKDAKHKTRAVAASGGEIQISAVKNVFALLTAIQDEVHRFSITFMREKHKKDSFALLLTAVKGIGEAKATALIRRFKTKQGLKEASLEALCETARISEEKARELQRFIKENM